MMAPYCIPKKSCITHGAGWINGSHPSEAYQLVSTNACFHFQSNCCLMSSPVQIRNCHGYYVYKLQKPEKCHYRYCGVKGLYVYYLRWLIKQFIFLDRAQHQLHVNKKIASVEEMESPETIAIKFRKGLKQ